MVYVNKSSLRTEFETIKGQFNELSAAGKVSAESGALFRALLMLFELMVAVFLEKTTKKDNRNSSLPSSQVERDDTSTQPGSHGKGPQQNEAHFANSRTLETVEVSTVETCARCAEDLHNETPIGHERRTRIDLVFEKVVEHVDAEIKTCPSCQGHTKGAFALDMTGPMQYGLGIKAYILELLIAQRVSLSRMQKLLKALIGRVISEATALKYIVQLDEALQAWERRGIEQLLSAPTVHVDETSMRVDKTTYWVHVYSTGATTVKFLHRRRGSEAIDEIGVIPRYGGVIVHDCWASYLSYSHCDHGLCGAHLLRELTFIVESNGYAWALNMKRLLQQTCKKVGNSKPKQLSEREYATLQKRYRTILTRGSKELPPVPERLSGQRGRIAKSDAHNLWQRLQTHEAAVLLFAKKPEVPFTNNRAERDLRMGKVKQKVSGCFRQARFARAYCRISSYLQTMAYKGVNPLVAIQIALSGELYASDV
jgi:hypothetical protein